MVGKTGAIGKSAMMLMAAGILGYATAQSQPNFNSKTTNSPVAGAHQDTTDTNSVDIAALAKKVSSLVDIVKSKGNSVSGTLNGENVNYKEYDTGKYILQNFDDYLIIMKTGPKGFAYIDKNKDGTSEAYAKNVPIGTMSSMDYTQDLINIINPSDKAHAIINHEKMHVVNSETNNDYAAAVLEVEGALEIK